MLRHIVDATDPVTYRRRFMWTALILLMLAWAAMPLLAGLKAWSRASSESDLVSALDSIDPASMGSLLMKGLVVVAFTFPQAVFLVGSILDERRQLGPRAQDQRKTEQC